MVLPGGRSGNIKSIYHHQWIRLPLLRLQRKLQDIKVMNLSMNVIFSQNYWTQSGDFVRSKVYQHRINNEKSLFQHPIVKILLCQYTLCCFCTPTASNYLGFPVSFDTLVTRQNIRSDNNSVPLNHLLLTDIIKGCPR